MIDIRQQEELLIAVGNIFKRKIIIYAIGGTAMMLKSIKDSTLDIDFVFDKIKDREEFILVLKELGAKESEAKLVYGLKENTPIMLELGTARFDLFLNQIITSTFSEKMKERAKEIHEFGANLEVRVADIHDIIFMKSSTSRTKDLDDIVAIIKKNPINWEVIINEAKEQVSFGNEKAILSLGEKLEELNNKKLVAIPDKVLNQLWNLLKSQINKRIKQK